MNRSKGQKPSLHSKKVKLLDPLLLWLLGIAALTYYLIWVAIYALFGGSVASWLATPLWGIPVFIIARWDRIRTQQDISWQDYIKFPQLRFWKLLVIILIIFSVQVFFLVVLERYQEWTRPDFIMSLPDDQIELRHARYNDWQSFIFLMLTSPLSYFIGGFVAGKLSPYKYLSPYGHATVGGFLLVLISYSFDKIYMWNDFPFTQEDVGIFVLLIPPTTLLSIFGAWVATRKQLLPSSKKSSKAPGMLNSEIDSAHSTGPVSSIKHEAKVDRSQSLKLKAFPRKRKGRKHPR